MFSRGPQQSAGSSNGRVAAAGLYRAPRGAGAAAEASGADRHRVGVVVSQLVQQQEAMAGQQQQLQQSPYLLLQQGDGAVRSWRQEQQSASGVSVTAKKPEMSATAAAAFLTAAGGGEGGRGRQREQQQLQQYEESKQQQERSKVKRFFSVEKMNVARAFCEAGGSRHAAAAAPATGKKKAGGVERSYYQRLHEEEEGKKTEEVFQQKQQQLRSVSPKGSRPLRSGTPPRRPGDRLGVAAASLGRAGGREREDSSSKTSRQAEGIYKEKFETSVEGIRIYYVESSSDEQQEQPGLGQQQSGGREEERRGTRTVSEEEGEQQQLLQLQQQLQNVCRPEFADAARVEAAAAEHPLRVGLTPEAAEAAEIRSTRPHRQQQRDEKARKDSRHRREEKQRMCDREEDVTTVGGKGESGGRAKEDKTESSRGETGRFSVAKGRDGEERRLGRLASRAVDDPPSPPQKFSRRTLHRLIMKQFKVASLNPADIRLAIRYRSLFIEDYKDLLGVNRLPTLSGHVHTAPLEKNKWMNRVVWSGRFFVLRHGHWFWFRDEKSYRVEGCGSCLGSVSLLLNSFSIDLHARYTTRFSIVVGDWLGMQIDTSIARRDRGQWVLYFLAAGNLGEQIRLCFPDVDWTEVQSRARLIAQQNILL